mmetsp:Transcript_60889/g.130890  ORF Transcript_60889/g.130890 Transcript_60889/m.130890 type:complete len:239 (+) Transcript_60889:869-1585(+)
MGVVSLSSFRTGGSKEKYGALPVDLYTCNASIKYSMFTAADGSQVGASRTQVEFMSSSMTKQTMPWGKKLHSNRSTRRRLRGICSAFQPTWYLRCRSCFSSASIFKRASSSTFILHCLSWAKHSPCMGLPVPSSPQHTRLPMGKLHTLHKKISSPSESSATSNAFLFSASSANCAHALLCSWDKAITRESSSISVRDWSCCWLLGAGWPTRERIAVGRLRWPGFCPGRLQGWPFTPVS